MIEKFNVTVNENVCDGYKECKRWNKGEACVESCPTGAIQYSEMEDKIITSEDRCTGCNKCVAEGCPKGAIEISKNEDIDEQTEAMTESDTEQELEN